MKAINYITMEFPSTISNEGFARAASAALPYRDQVISVLVSVTISTCLPVSALA